MSEQLSAALQYLSIGWQPVAAPVKGKAPIRQWKNRQTEVGTEREVREDFARPANVFLVTGAVSRLLVLDCDDETALAYWTDRLGADVLEATTRVKTGHGFHFYFRTPPGLKVRNRSVSDESGKWDIRGEGGGVIAPPSVHPSGRRYEWEKDPSFLQDAPEALLEIEAGNGGGDPNSRSLLSHLLSHPPAEGGRNNWLAQVAGHYAKYIPHQDAFEAMVRDAASRCSPPLPEEEVVKTIASIWQTEQAKEGKAAPDLDEDGADRWRKNLLQPTEDTGWLVSGGRRIMVQTRHKKEIDGKTAYELALATWLDCDIRVLGLVEADRDQVYGVELRFPDGSTVEDYLPSKVVSDSRLLGAWLASHGASVGPPDTMWPVKMRESTRLLRYLRAQGAEPMVAAEALGWHRESEAFITHEGVIRAIGPGPFENVRPDPGLRGWAPYRYGHAGKDQARQVLREVLTFHDEQVAAVFGAWWAATLLKPQIQDRASQFPFMALEASSESGKTTGFFSLMLQLAGNHSGQSNPTRAALRDYLSAHNNGIVWVDDLDDLGDLGELLRNVTVGGSLVKKGDGNHAQVVAQLRAALVVSGESLGLHDQKALVDRAVLLDVPSPTDRKSKKGDYPQWDDIVALRTTCPDLTDFAGSLVELALEASDVVEDLKSFRYGSGRHADMLAIIRAGARILASMAGDQWPVAVVDGWAKEQEAAYSGKENVLTLKLLPLALERTGWLARPEGPDQDRRKVATPAFCDENDIVWFSPSLLAAWWEREPPMNKRLNPRVESPVALEQQARELGLGGRKGVGRKDFRLVGREGTQRYWKCTKDLSRTLLQRSRGQLERGETHDPDADELF